MIKFETPICFDDIKENMHIQLEYISLTEISQGGPVVGQLIVNGFKFNNAFFGGPCILYHKFIVIPIYTKRMFSAGFRIAIINSDNMDLTKIGDMYDLIYLDKIDKNKIYFYTDLNKSKTIWLEY